MILTRGKIIGDVLDCLSQLAYAINTRSSVGLYDINKHCEDFIKDLLNLVYEYNLNNLNEMRSNEPGLDLGDDKNKVAFQVTADRTSQKVNNTLEKITEEQGKKYSKIYIFILGTKQTSYKIDDQLAEKYNFSRDNILDFSDIEKKVISLPTEKLNLVNRFLEVEFIRILSDFNVGESPSGDKVSILSKIESVPVSNYRNCLAVMEYTTDTYGYKYEKEQIDEAYKEFIKMLENLPKITREFYYAFLIRSEYSGRFDDLAVRYELVKRTINISQRMQNEEISLLRQHKLIRWYDDDPIENYIVFNGTFNDINLLSDLVDFSRNKNISIKEIIVDLNFSSIEK